ncbi:cysteine peptidase C11 family protein [Edaphobacter aggregans]|uniref:Cysteine peptidase C11 family protein n=1 Tax=Edaphobacter aggregans TaxID=570835 RepID=A0A3R9PTR4_9BACT|nr:clostripain-related cysteine peptidase [Edaphobacter aggregans]RSL17695.1 cysteine peptidase C11 family protein [Edaphobacter aggregans]
MKRPQIRKKLSILAILWVTGTAMAVPTADWTIMVYMNAKNTLECDALENFAQLATLGSTSTVPVVAELGRPKLIMDGGKLRSRNRCGDKEPWDGVLRFFVTKNQQPLPRNAVQMLGAADMGSAETLRKFVDWAKTNYPAKHYLLVIWNHGQGWRFQTSPNQAVNANFSRDRIPALLTEESNKAGTKARPLPPVGGFRSVSFDGDTKHFLYNRDIQDSLGSLLGARKLDVIGFDACLMAMIESGYAFRSLATVLVASEELEPDRGWDYGDILRQVQDHAGALDARGMGELLVESYKRVYRDRLKTTLSAIKLDNVDGFADAISRLAVELVKDLALERQQIANARVACRNYGENQNLTNSIDVRQFATKLLEVTKNGEVLRAAKEVTDLLDAQSLVYSHYASKRSQGDYGSFGISIYFPASKHDFDEDADKDGYLRSNSNHAVEFVQKNEWSRFLDRYLKLSGN